MGQAHAPERRIHRKTHRCKLNGMGRPKAEDHQEVQLGRDLAAAFIAACHGTGLDYARNISAGQPVGEYWTALARMVIADQNNCPAPSERVPIIHGGRLANRPTARFGQVRGTPHHQLNRRSRLLVPNPSTFPNAVSGEF